MAFKKNTIGIGVTIFNRHETASYTIEQIKKYFPKNAKLAIVDDASDEPFLDASFRFENNMGLSYSKNKCIELLDDCEHIFLFDDDCYPKVKDWHLPYIKSGIKHLSFTFDYLMTGRSNMNTFLKKHGNLIEYRNPCGCMLYIHHDCIDKVGGFDTRFVKYSFEHVEYSNRVYNAGITPYRFLDVENSLDLFVSLDHQIKVSCSVKNRLNFYKLNQEHYQEVINSSEYHDYKIYQGLDLDSAVLCSYFNSQLDPQRGIKWEANTDKVKALSDSVTSKKVTLIVFHDCFKNVEDTEYLKFVKVTPDPNYSVNIYRWVVYNDFLKNNNIKEVFMVDSTDVEMLKNPFGLLEKNKLYLGSEYSEKVSSRWMKKNQEPLLKRLRDYKYVIALNKKKMLVNCGIVGGQYNIVKSFLQTQSNLHKKYTKGITKSTDMAIFNYTIWKYFSNHIVYGEQINTRFKKFEYNDSSWFKHK